MKLKLRRGSLFLYRVFDIAEEIQLPIVEKILKATAPQERLRLAPKSREAVIIRNAPVRFTLPETTLLPGHPFFDRVETVATLWDYGVLSISYQKKLPEDLPWQDLLSVSNLVTNNEEFLSVVDAASQMKAREVVDLIGAALLKPTTSSLSEDYVIYFFEDISGAQSGADFFEKGQIAELLLGEIKDPLSEDTRQSILQNMYQYADNDLVVIDWNSAVVLEPSGQRDIPDVLEFALTQLLEVRYYDDLLDQRLRELYDSIEKGRQRLLRNTFESLSKEANTRFIEFSEFMERMGNSLKVVGDFYLARIFRGANRRFRVNDWEQNITRKMNLLTQVSALLHGETNIRRSHLLEIIIILLILFEVISAMYKGFV